MRSEVPKDTTNRPQALRWAASSVDEEAAVAWFRRRGAAAGGRGSSRDDIAHLEQFARDRRGVEAFIEPRTAVTETTVILIAHDGEWTRRRVASPAAARQFGAKLGIPVYDTALVGYPQRMRDYNERQRQRD
jgi:hypothetical protein